MKTKKETLTFRQVVIILLLCFSALIRTAGAQQIAKDSTGNYITLSKAQEPAKDTGKTLTLADGQKLPIMVSSNGKYFVIRTSKKTNKQYKQYLNIPQ